MGSAERSIRAVMDLGRQIVADRTLPVPPVHRVAGTDVADSDELGLVA
tara:strand:+ start:413 stop:556 length:144 start_codon:yes stop_codon:yes gene_type:complete